MHDTEEYIKQKLSLLPEEPGVYRFLDRSGSVIYVGKAKNLKKRVSSYFVSQSTHTIKVRALVRHIADIVHIVVPTEADALFLENNMIKTLQPKYNILLKDDKTYPWIVITNEPYPRAIQTRNLIRDGSHYFGPYSSVSMQKNMLDLVQKLYFLRTCSLKLTTEKIKAGKFSPCLQYHIGNCKGPCIDGISQQEYLEQTREAASVLKGQLKQAEDFLKNQMLNAADTLLFEEAERYKKRLEMLGAYRSKSIVVSGTANDMDVFSIEIDGDAVFCNFMSIIKGSIVNSYTIEMRQRIEEEPMDIFTFAIHHICQKLDHSLAPEVIVPLLPDPLLFKGVLFTVPQRGDKLKLLEMSQKNCRIAKIERMKYIEKADPQRHTNRIMELMRKELELDREPRHIECFDNSNLQGTYPVSSCVVFRDGKPSRSEYRRFNIKTVVGIDDFASMRETVLRRYQRMLKEETPLPDLIVVDGGKGQLSSAYAILKELGIEHKVPIIGLAKRMEEIFYPSESYPHYINKNSETLKVLMHIRDEAHRFGITFHRNKRSKGFLTSELEAIPSLGEKSIEKLMKQFKSFKNIEKASFEALSTEIGNKRAGEVIRYFQEKKINQTNEKPNEKIDIRNK